jgi:FMN phosphatase YigB (HAD superfamily)
LACEVWRLAPSDVLYVGDRADIDARGAAVIGMPCAILGSPGASDTSGWPHVGLRGMRDLLVYIERGEVSR